MGGLDLALGETDGDAADFLNGPADQRRVRTLRIPRFVFGGVIVFARRRIAAIMAKASMTSET